VASTKDRQRALERARYERVQAKIQRKRKEAKRKQRVALVSSIATIAVIGGIVAGVVLSSSPSSSTKAGSAAATSSASTAATPVASASGNPMAYEAAGTSAVKGITMPTFNAAAAEKTYTVTIQTNRGNIVFTANGKAAPYTVYSFVYLVDKGYFNNTPCPRISNTGLYMLQCGDPTGTGSGGPGYTIPDENLTAYGTGAEVTYPAGSVAMANTGAAHSGGSQFFLVFQNSQLAPSYTPFGTITQGLDILKGIAAKGNDGSSSAGGGKPNETVTIQKVTATAQS
jgi:peptidyl-prolyl cis-trans isomerase B (cyclophilin B)